MLRRLSVFLLIFLLMLGAGCRRSEDGKNDLKTPLSVSDQAEVVKSPYVEKISKSRHSSDSFVLVSFNGCNFGKSKSVESLAFIANIFRNVDLIAIQEVSTSDFGARAVAQLADELNRRGSKWDYVVSNSTHDGASKERYAYLWKTSQIDAMPRSVELLTSLEGDLEREPAKAVFTIKGKTLNFISFHLVPAGKHPINEVNKLISKRDVFPAGNVIVSGDFNLDHGKLSEVFEIGLNFEHQIEGKTSLKSKFDNGNYYMKEYDNIFVRGDITIHRAGILDFVPSFSDLSAARQVSDHLPVFIEFSLN